MAISIISNLTQNKFYPSANPINTTVSSNNSGKCNFRYICDVYINGIFVFRDKLFPDPNTGFGFFQISRVLSDFVETQLQKTSYSSVISAAATGVAPDSAFSFFFRFGEEYDATLLCDGAVTQFLNLATSNTAFLFQAAIDYEEWPSFNYVDYLVGTVSGGAEFLTHTQKEIEVCYNDPYSLDFISLAAVGPSHSVRLTRNFVSGSQSITTIAATNLGTKRRFRLAVGPIDLNRITQAATISPLIKNYTIELLYAGVQVSETFTFKVIDPKAFRTRIGFVGLLGGIEHFTFYHRLLTSFEVERKTFAKTLQSNYSSALTYQVGDRGDSVYGVSAQQINSVGSFCDKETSEWLYEMWLSPNVFTYKRPDLYNFRPIQDGASIKYWVDGKHGLAAGDAVFSFSDTALLNGFFTASSVNGNIVDFGFTASYAGTLGSCGLVQKNEAWQTLPIVISDNTIEVKQRAGRPIQYSLNYKTAYQKTTLR